MKILLTGKNGQLGFELQRALSPLGEVVAVDREECDLADPQAIRRMVQTVRPAVVINAAAYTAVDKAETDANTAFQINAAAPGVLGEEAEALGAWVIHYSTDYVFDGAKPTPYTEEDATHPLGVYGASKCQGELALQNATAHHLILRSSWLLGAHGGNFAKTMLKLAAEREHLRVVADQWGAPTSAALLADLTAHLLRQHQRETAAAFPYGLYHAVAAGETTWHDYARFVITEAIKAGRPVKVDPAKIEAVTTADYPLPAQRPANSRLATGKLQQTFGFYLPHWQAGLRHVLQQIF